MTQPTSIAFTAPHWAAMEAGIRILQQGGTATEAMVAAAAVITVVYPHMNSIGGDSFWLVHNLSDTKPIAIDACGRSASNLSRYQSAVTLNSRGGEACITQAGTIRGWQAALAEDKNASLSLSELLADAIRLAEQGIEVTSSLTAAINKVLAEANIPESFKALYAPEGRVYRPGDMFCNPMLANTFKTLAEQGLDSFYQGTIADSVATTLQREGSALTLSDHQSTKADVVEPLMAQLDGIQCFNLPAPTQGVHSLQILSLTDRLKDKASTAADWAHLVIEATKQAFSDRSRILADPAHVPTGYSAALSDSVLSAKAQQIDMNSATAWPFVSEHGDTVWMGARDSNGQLVSFIQSVYWEFGSAVVIDNCGFTWNNRGISFTLEGGDINALEPNKKPRHTLNPAMALFDNGKRMAYGTMGGEGQPQTQAALFSRYVWQGTSLEEAIATGRWLLGRTWGDATDDLKVEADLAEQIGDELTARNHQWQAVPACNEMMGHAGAIVDENNVLEAVTDPRSDGRATVSTLIQKD
jgi:oxamate amidohydrolase